MQQSIWKPLFTFWTKISKANIFHILTSKKVKILSIFLNQVLISIIERAFRALSFNPSDLEHKIFDLLSIRAKIGQIFSIFPYQVLISIFERSFRALSFNPSDLEYKIFDLFLIWAKIEQIFFRAFRSWSWSSGWIFELSEPNFERSNGWSQLYVEVSCFNF